MASLENRNDICFYEHIFFTNLFFVLTPLSPAVISAKMYMLQRHLKITIVLMNK